MSQNQISILWKGSEVLEPYDDAEEAKYNIMSQYDEFLQDINGNVDEKNMTKEQNRLKVWTNFLGRSERTYTLSELKTELDDYAYLVLYGEIYLGNTKLEKENGEIDENISNVLFKIKQILELK